MEARPDPPAFTAQGAYSPSIAIARVVPNAPRPFSAPKASTSSPKNRSQNSTDDPGGKTPSTTPKLSTAHSSSKMPSQSTSNASSPRKTPAQNPTTKLKAPSSANNQQARIASKSQQKSAKSLQNTRGTVKTAQNTSNIGDVARSQNAQNTPRSPHSVPSAQNTPKPPSQHTPNALSTVENASGPPTKNAPNTPENLLNALTVQNAPGPPTKNAPNTSENPLLNALTVENAPESVRNASQNDQKVHKPRQRKSKRGDNQNRNNIDLNADDQEDLALLVHVSGFPPYTQAADLVRTFSHCGAARVELLQARSSSAALAFADQEGVRKAIQASRHVNVYGEFLTVRPLKPRDLAPKLPPKREFPLSKQNEVIVQPSEIDLTGDFHQQMFQILSAVRLTQAEVSAISSLYADLERVLQALWPGAVAMPFGSITTGLGIKTSDADCYLHIPNIYYNQHQNFVHKAKRILQNHPNLFAEIFSIPRANTPIVKFFYIPTGTNCDLSFKTPLGTQNSKLIAFLLHTDPRLIPMAVVIKYWAKVHGFSGSGKLTNYALTMMIIFYLQQLPMTILPTVQWLQRDPKYDVIVDYWNTGFMDKQELVPPCSNTSSVSELLGGFFEYYSMFNFEDMVVCPYLGTPVKKDAFNDLAQLPAEFDLYKTNVMSKFTPPMRVMTAMCVQDPFEQCHNVASAISNRLAADVRAYFKFAANAYEEEKLKGCQDFLKTILLEKPKLVKAKAHPEFKVTIFQQVIDTIVEPDWKATVRDVVLVIFETILKVNLGKVEEKVQPDAKKQKERYTGMITKAIWKRKQFARLYAMMNLDFIQKQARITEEILNVEKVSYKINFTLTITYVMNPKHVFLAVKLGTGDLEMFKEFGRFFSATMHGWVSTLLKPHTKPIPLNSAAQIAETIKQIDNNNDLDSDDDDEMEDNKGDETDTDVNNDDNDVSQSTDDDSGSGSENGKGDATAISASENEETTKNITELETNS